MKPANFPARKLARQIAAEIRSTVAFLRIDPPGEVIQARTVRTKKNRTARGLRR